MEGYIINNSQRSKHIFQRRISPGNRISLSEVEKVIKNLIPEDGSLVQLIRERFLPEGWELVVQEEPPTPARGPNGMFVERLIAKPQVVSAEEVMVFTDHPTPGDQNTLNDSSPSLEYANQTRVDKLTARDIYNLRVKDNPRRIIKMISSSTKLRRTLTLCNSDGRKDFLSKLIKRRLKELQPA
jgi:hypothetical protein